MADDNELIRERVESTVERINGIAPEEIEAIAPESLPEIDPLDVTAEVTARGDVKSVTLVLGTGGPHIEFDPTNEAVEGWWGNDHHRMPVSNSGVCENVHRYYCRHFEENLLA